MNITITDKCAVPATENSAHQHIQKNISLESPMESGTMQYNLCKKIVKSTRGLKIHQYSCKNNLLDDKDKLLDAVPESNNVVTRSTKDNTKKN